MELSNKRAYALKTDKCLHIQMISVNWNDIEMRVRALKRLKQIPESLRTLSKDVTVPRKEIEREVESEMLGGSKLVVGMRVIVES